MWPSRIKTNQGFTLMEMLLAISIFAVLGLAASTVLQQVVKVDEVSKDAQLRLKNLQQAMMMMERDFGQMVSRDTKDPNSTSQEEQANYFNYGPNVSGYEGVALRFYRLGWLNPQGLLPRSSVQQVVYRVENNTLQRLYTLYPDTVPDDEAEILELLPGVKDLSFSFYIEQRWQSVADGSVFPQAIAVSLETEDFGLIERRFLLSDGFVVEVPAVEGETQGEEQGQEGDLPANGDGGPEGNAPEGDGSAEGYAPEGEGGAEGFAQ